MSIVTRKTVVQVSVDWSALAAGVEALVMKKLEQDLVDWASDRGMVQMFLRDAADGLAVCDVIQRGNINDVVSRLWEMDTAAREYVYDFIEQVAGCDFEELRGE